MAKQLTEVRLLSVPLENDYKHTLYFFDRDTQAEYFTSKTVFVETELSYQRKDGFIRFPKHYDELEGVNYVMYRNEPYSTKWKYAFITSKKYVQDDRTDIYIETDVMQTYSHDYLLKPSFVEREHVDDDTKGKHTLPENLETGEYICSYVDQITDLSGCVYIVGVTELCPQESTGEWMSGGYRYNGIYSGIIYVAFPTTHLNDMSKFISYYAQEGKTDAIKSLFMYPEEMLTLNKAEFFPDGTEANSMELHLVVASEKPETLPKALLYVIPEIEGGDYTIKNNKLYTYPYNYLLVSNNNGASAIYQYEHFADSMGPMFEVYGCISPGGSIRLVPKDYKGVDYNNEEGLNLGKYPICNWTSDEYTNWLTQNSLNIGLNLAAGLGQIVAGVGVAVGSGGLGTAVGGGQVVGGVSTIANQLAQIHQMAMTPPQSQGNINCGDVITATNTNTFFFYQMRIKDEYVKIIDGYFNMFGYKVNTVKTPLEDHRENYWYTKTIDVSIDGAIPMEDMQKIKNCYNNGITFWRNPNKIGDYSVSNSII